MFLQYVATFVGIIFDLMFFAIIARVLMSWMPAGGGGQLKSILYDITEPVLSVFRNVIPRIGMMDISPIIAIFALDLLKDMILYMISYLALGI